MKPLSFPGLASRQRRVCYQVKGQPRGGHGLVRTQRLTVKAVFMRWTVRDMNEQTHTRTLLPSHITVITKLCHFSDSKFVNSNTRHLPRVFIYLIIKKKNVQKCKNKLECIFFLAFCYLCSVFFLHTHSLFISC